ncbi:hypothetical protein TeGR_g7143, partial [Tetraparma gracilis]
VKAAKSFEAADAKELGQLLVLDTDNVRGKRDPDPLEAKLRTFVDRSAVLRGARSTCPWIEVLLKEVLRNRLRVPKGSMKALEEFTEEDARKAGRGFANALVANATAEAAVDEWVMTYPALSELEQRPMMNAVASSILAQVAWGVKFRAYLGAGVSAADALSDAYMINEFYVMGKVSTANGLMAMVGANLGFQVLVVFIQTQGLKKDKWRTALVEMLSVVTFTKPGLDAYRVASGAEQLPGAAASPLMEMLYVKGGELFFEAIPGLVLQLVAVLLAKERSTSAYVSIWISTASTALTATTMFWDNDTDPGSPKGSTSKKSIQIQLSQFIEGVGQKDEVVMVAPSYFSNVIVKKNLGRQISDKEVAELQRAAASSAAAQKEESERVAKLLSEIGSICITRKRASGDKLFGSVTTKNISDALRERVAEEVLTSKAAKLSVVGVKGDIKTAGSYECELSLPQGVTAKFELVVAGSDEECAT